MPTNNKNTKSAKKSLDNRHRIILRNALLNENDTDKDVTKGISEAFMKYDRRGCDFVISFSAKLSESEVKWAFNTVKTNMESIYDASGFGWCDEDKYSELTEPEGRFLLVREKSLDKTNPGRLIGFCHFRFTVQGDVMDVMLGDPCIYVWDIHIDENYQRKGVGKHLLTLLSLIGSREKMMHICVPVQLFDDRSQQWIESIKGFSPDKSLCKKIGFDSELEGFEVYSKVLGKPQTPSSKSESPSQSIPSTNPVSNTHSGIESDISHEVKDDEFDHPDDEYDIVTKEEVKHLNEEGEENENAVNLSEEEVVEGLQYVFKEKHGREATAEEVTEWLKAISGLKRSEVLSDEK